jgi:histidine triad (HIT) family protein
MSEENCKFCQIIENKLPASFVFRNTKMVAFMDAFPITPGHVLIVPTTHYENIFQIPEQLLADTFKAARDLSIAIKSALDNVTGVTILQNNGASAGQRVFHFHVHVIPRIDEFGDRSRTVSARQPAAKDKLDEVAEKIRIKLRSIR